MNFPKHLLLWLSVLLLGFAPWFWIRPTPPTLSIVNESLAWMGWAGLVCWVLLPNANQPRFARRAWAFLPYAVPATLAIAVLADWASGRLPYPAPGLLMLAFLLLAALCFAAGRRAAEWHDRGFLVWDRVSVAWVMAALLTTALGAWQFFRPLGAYPWVAALAYTGRVYGNIRQPNHMATMLAMGWVLLVWLAVERRQVRTVLMLLASCLLLAGMAMTGSRTGAVSVLVVSVAMAMLFWWRGQWRWWVLAFPLVYAVCWLVIAWLDQAGLYQSFGVDRLRQTPQGTDVTGARLDAWLATWDMIRAHPWTGVGTGRFGFFFMLGDWSRPATLQFGNAHNLFLHLAAEHGIPLVLGATLALTWYGVKCLQTSPRTDPFWVSWLLPIPVLVHSQFEFPLWYAYFLFPFCFALGSMAGAARREPLPPGDGRAGRQPWLRVGGLALILAPLALLWSNFAMRAIYFPEQTPIFKRVQLAQSSFLFRHHADHALLSTAPPELTNAPEVGPVFTAVAQVILDAGLLSNWIIHSAMNGQVEQARHMAYALYRLNPEIFDALRVRVQKSSDPQLVAMQDFMQHPVQVPYPMARLLREPGASPP